LNEAEARYSDAPKHWNARRVYPFWKVCQNCKRPFPARTIEQANRNKACGAACAAILIAAARTGEIRKPRIRCAHCGAPVIDPPPSRRARQVLVYCSRSCRAKANVAHLLPFSGNGKGKPRPDMPWMIGERNPAWKGGLTYHNRKGAYADQPIRYVRCPVPFLIMARRDGYVMEHRLLVAQALNRPLTRAESVHHQNHKATDNSLTNLMLFATNGQHKAFEHGRDIKPLWCGLCHSDTSARSGACECRPGPLLPSAME